ncbi:MAG: RRXRR domain-containing protein, partial [Pseudothermotoga sp.]
KPEEWLAPSLRWKVDAHIRIVKMLSKIIPIDRVVVEVAPFDIQKKTYNVQVTYGSITKAKRREFGLEKTHKADAYVIAGGTVQERTKERYLGKFFRRQNRSLHKVNPIKGGRRPVNTIREARGFRRFDKVEYKNRVGIISGLRSSGYFSITTLSGEKISDSVRCSDLKLLEKSKTLMFERREAAVS